MKPNIIKTTEEYKTDLERLEIIFDAKLGTPQGDELEVFARLIDEYEKEHFSILRS